MQGLNLTLTPANASFTQNIDRWSPASLFSNGEKGAWYDPSDASTLFIERDNPVTPSGVGDPVGMMLDKSGNDKHLFSPDNPSRPVFDAASAKFLNFDGVDDAMLANAVLSRNYQNATLIVVASNQSGTVGNQTVALQNEKSGPAVSQAPDSTIRFFDGFFAWDRGNVPRATVHCRTTIKQGSTYSEYLNGDRVLDPKTRENETQRGSGLRVGTVASAVNCQIYSILVVEKVLTEAERVAAEDYMFSP